MTPGLDGLARRLEEALARAPAEPADEERRAAVAMILRAQEEDGPAARTAPDVLLMRRREHPEDRWSGQISLPGGHKDPGDADLLATALREAREEVGVDLARSARLVGRLPRVQARARGRIVPMGITPFVFEVTRAVAPHPGIEAREVFWFPLARAGTGELDQEYRFTRDDGLVHTLPSWRHEERIVWGLTHRMLAELLRLLSD